MENLVVESKEQKEHTAARAGLSGARHAAEEKATLDTKERVREDLDSLVDRVKGLRKLTAEASLFLPVYELRRAQEVQACVPYMINISIVLQGWIESVEQ